MLRKICLVGMALFFIGACQKEEGCHLYYEAAAQNVFHQDSLKWMFSNNYLSLSPSNTPPSPDCVTETILTLPLHGELIHNEDTMYYVPNANYIGLDSFEYEDRFCQKQKIKLRVWKNSKTKCIYEFDRWKACYNGTGYTQNERFITYRVAPVECKECITSINYTYIPPEGQVEHDSILFWSTFKVNSHGPKIKDKLEYEVCIDSFGQEKCRSFTLNFKLKAQ